jgi:hypothetical protein
MENIQGLLATCAGVVAVTVGASILNSVVAPALLGKTGMETYTFSALQAFCYFAYFVTVGFVVALAAGRTRTVVLAGTAILSEGVLLFSSAHWFEPSLSVLEITTAYLLAEAPNLAVVPALAFVWWAIGKRNDAHQIET